MGERVCFYLFKNNNRLRGASIRALRVGSVKPLPRRVVQSHIHHTHTTTRNTIDMAEPKMSEIRNIIEYLEYNVLFTFVTTGIIG